MRFYDKAYRKYVLRALKTNDLSEATDKAIGMWSDIQPRIEQGHPISNQSIANSIEE